MGIARSTRFLIRCVVGCVAVLGWLNSATAQETAAKEPLPTVTPMHVNGVPALTTALQQPTLLPDGILIEDFSLSTIGLFPSGWRPKAAKGNNFYKVMEESGKKYLKGDVIKDGSSIFREVGWDLKKYPILEWNWRPRVLPLKGNEKNQSTNDCSVALYIVFPVRWFVPDTLKYVWSTTLPVGTEFGNGFGKQNKIHVMRSGATQLNQWVVERRNIFEDYKRRFERNPADPMAFGVITDADNTKSVSGGDYGYFKLLTLEQAKGLTLSP